MSDTITLVREVTYLGKVIGRIGRDQWGYVSHAYGCEMGHGFIDTEDEAEADVVSMYREKFE
jgi:hypothetical protein